MMETIKEFIKNYPVLYEVCKLFFIFFMVGSVVVLCMAINFIFKIAERIREEWLDF